MVTKKERDWGKKSQGLGINGEDGEGARGGR